MKISINHPPKNSTCHLPSDWINAIMVAHDSSWRGGCRWWVSCRVAGPSARCQRGFEITSIMETFERFKIVEDGAMDWTRVWSGANDAELKMFDVAGTVIFVR